MKFHLKIIDKGSVQKTIELDMLSLIVKVDGVTNNDNQLRKDAIMLVDNRLYNIVKFFK